MDSNKKKKDYPTNINLKIIYFNMSHVNLGFLEIMKFTMHGTTSAFFETTIVAFFLLKQSV